MATKLYLAAARAPVHPTAEQSSTFPNGTLHAPSSFQWRALKHRLALSGHGTFANEIGPAATTHYDCFVSAWCAELNGTDITAQTWTIALSGRESNAAMNAYFNWSMYVWRPSNNTVVGYIRDVHDGVAGGIREIGATAYIGGDISTDSGSAVANVDP